MNLAAFCATRAHRARAVCVSSVFPRATHNDSSRRQQFPSYSARKSCFQTYSFLQPWTSTVPSQQIAPFSFNSSGTEDKKKDSVGILQRFKNAYKEYGKVLIGVHCVTSAVWFGAFYYAAVSGFDVIPLLEKLGASEKIIKPFQSSGVGDIAVAYLLYKLATPARYTVTIGGTQYTVKALRQLGYMEAVPEGDSFRELMKEGRQQVKVKVDDRKEKMKDKMGDIREKIADAKDDAKDKMDDIREKIADAKGDAKDKMEDMRDKWTDAKEDAKDKYKDKVDEFRDKIKERTDKDKIKDKL